MNRIFISALLLILLISCDDNSAKGVNGGFTGTDALSWTFNPEDSTFYVDVSTACNENTEELDANKWAEKYDCERIRLQIKTFDYVKSNGSDSLAVSHEIDFDTDSLASMVLRLSWSKANSNT